MCSSLQLYKWNMFNFRLRQWLSTTNVTSHCLNLLLYITYYVANDQSFSKLQWHLSYDFHLFYSNWPVHNSYFTMAPILLTCCAMYIVSSRWPLCLCWATIHGLSKALRTCKSLTGINLVPEFMRRKNSCVFVMMHLCHVMLNKFAISAINTDMVWYKILVCTGDQVEQLTNSCCCCVYNIVHIFSGCILLTRIS